MSTKLSIKSSNYYDDKKTVTDNINYVNPNIDNQTALALAQKFNALTKNAYLKTLRIDETIVDDSIKYPITTSFLYNSVTYPGTSTEPVQVPLSAVNSNREFSINFTFSPSPNEIFLYKPIINENSYTADVQLAQTTIYGGYSGGNIRFRLPSIATGKFSFLYKADLGVYQSVSREVFVQITEG